jgi:hypothetical protein
LSALFFFERQPPWAAADRATTLAKQRIIDCAQNPARCERKRQSQGAASAADASPDKSAQGDEASPTSTSGGVEVSCTSSDSESPTDVLTSLTDEAPSDSPLTLASAAVRQPTGSQVQLNSSVGHSSGLAAQTPAPVGPVHQPHPTMGVQDPQL